mmetsp:Transcript_56270/g.132595  ORF Transcript_56270/g.132595 Transcript_56270/m.132595 type:complete len:202 (-) Transcript_56270:123-728(-)
MEGVPGGGLPAGAATSMTQVSEGVWGWAGAEKVNASLSALQRDLGGKGKPKTQPCYEVIKGLWIGSSSCLPSVEDLEKGGVMATFAVGEDVPVVDDKKFMHNKIALPDENTGSLLPTFPKAFKAIREGIEDGGVFLYCQSRQGSSALATGYLMANEGMTFDDAWKKVQESCPECEELNRNLKRQLTTWAKWPEFPGLPEWM